MSPSGTREKFFALLLTATMLAACNSGGGGGSSDVGVPLPNPTQSADLVLRGGVVYTVDESNTQAEAIAISDGVILYVGSSDGATEFVGEQTKVIYLEGKTVLPGLHDSHLHPLEAGSSVAGTCFTDSEADILAVEFQEFLNDCAPQQRGDIEWVLGFGHSIFQLLDLPATIDPIDILDDAIPDQPTAFLEETSHSVWVNSAALQLAGIDRHTPDPAGGAIGRDANGDPNGLLLDNAGDIVYEMAFLPPTETLLNLHYEGLLFALEQIASNGITSIVNARVYTRRGYLDVWQRAVDEDTLTARTILALWAYPSLQIGESDEDQIAFLSELFDDNSESLLKISQIKFYSDGILINETAATIAPYPLDEQMPFFVSADHRGLNYFTEDRLAAYISELEKVGYDANIHAIGDRAVREALNAIELVANTNGESVDRRHRITHLELVDPQDYQRFAELDVIADFQVAGDFTLPIPGESADGYLPVKSIYDTGARITLSSDWDVSSLSPFVGMQNSLNRAEESLPDLRAALRAYTIDAAYLMRSEESTGSIEEGKLADIIVIDQNIFEIPTNRIGETQVLLTLLAGEEVFRATSFDAAGAAVGQQSE